jgi:UDPglucose 6-dehydrogenase
MIGFIGLSHLGITSSLAAASKGFHVVGYDPNGELCDDLNNGNFPIYEPGLNDLYTNNKASIEFSSNKSELARCDVIYLSLDIHTDEEGRSDLTPLMNLFSSVATSIPEQCILIITSQVPPGFTRQLSTSYRSLLEEKRIQLYYQVETLIFGTAVERALNPERIIIGCADLESELPAPYAKLLDVFACPVLTMGYESAEMSKLSINVCLAAAISAANTLAELCESIGADWYEIMPALKSDKRIGQWAYLTPGLGIGGGNLDRDLVTVCRLGYLLEANVGVIEAFRANSKHRCDWVMQVLRTDGVLPKGTPTIAVWGLAYKAGTQSTKNSPALYLMESMTQCEIRCFDPQVIDVIDGDHCTRYSTPLETCEGADVLVIMTPWDEFSKVDLSEVEKLMKNKVIVDPFRVVDNKACQRFGFNHIRLGESGHRKDVAQL